MRHILGRFERQHEKLLSNRQFVARMLRFMVLAVTVELAVIVIGAFGFYCIAGLNWLDGALNATMIITGNGPAYAPKTEGAKIFQIIYSLSGVISFVLILTVMMAPVLHRILHHFQIVPDDGTEKTTKK